MGHPFKNRDPRLEATVVTPGSIFAGYQFETFPIVSNAGIIIQHHCPHANQDATNPYATFRDICGENTREKAVNTRANRK
jgi:hypothetical protein